VDDGMALIPLWVRSPTPEEELGVCRSDDDGLGVEVRYTPLSEKTDPVSRTRVTSTRYERVHRHGPPGRRAGVDHSLADAVVVPASLSRERTRHRRAHRRRHRIRGDERIDGVSPPPCAEGKTAERVTVGSVKVS